MFKTLIDQCLESFTPQYCEETYGAHRKLSAQDANIGFAIILGASLLIAGATTYGLYRHYSKGPSELSDTVGGSR